MTRLTIFYLKLNVFMNAGRYLNLLIQTNPIHKLLKYVKKIIFIRNITTNLIQPIYVQILSLKMWIGP